MTDILQTIDQAIDDYSVSDDAMRWDPAIAARQNGKASAVQFVRMTLRVELTAEQRELVLATYRELGRRIAVAVDPVIRALDEFHRQLETAGLIPPPAPVDPMQRALEARRNRNTGPAVPLRAPRRIDPRRAR